MKESLGGLERALLEEMEWALGTGGTTLQDRLREVANALGYPEYHGGKPEVYIRELWDAYIERYGQAT